MGLYQVVNLFIDSEEMPLSYSAFQCRKAEADLLEKALKISYCPLEELKGGFSEICEVSGLKVGGGEQGWLFEDLTTGCRMLISPDYSGAVLSENVKKAPELWGFLIQIFIECRLLDEGVLTVHSSCVELDGKAFAFSGPSGCGKSTRAFMWARAFAAPYLSGDRPAMDVKNKRVYGIPWDGKEQIFRNSSAEVGAIFQVRRSSFTRIRRLSEKQARSFLISQIFIPMWDSERAMEAMVLLSRLVRDFPIYRLFCDRDQKAARETKTIMMEHQENILEVDRDMKLNEGFVLKSMAGEFVLMPAGANIARFNGSVLLNEVSAFVIRQLEAGPCGISDLTDLVLQEYEADRETVQSDLEELMDQLCEMGVVSRD